MEYLVKSVIKGTHRVVWVYELYFSDEKIQVPGNLLNQIIKNFLRCNNWLTGTSLAQCHQVDWSFHKGTTNLWKLFSAWKNYEAPQLIIFFPPKCEIYCELFTQGLSERRVSRGCSQPPSAACLHRIRAKQENLEATYLSNLQNSTWSLTGYSAFITNFFFFFPNNRFDFQLHWYVVLQKCNAHTHNLPFKSNYFIIFDQKYQIIHLIFLGLTFSTYYKKLSNKCCDILINIPWL